jgi:Family of unknown function (DUF6159)
MFERISRSWGLVKASWNVLRADKELIIFPFISSIGVIIVSLSFLVPSLLAGIFDQARDEGGVPVAGYIVGFLFYVVMYTVIIFFNSALVGAATIRLKGGDPSVRDGFNIAFSHMGSILGYAVISATVGMVLRALRERGGIVGAIASMIGGIAWSLATFLVVPVLVIEGIGPIEAVKRSAGLLKQTWGEQVVGNLSIGLIFGLLTFALIIVFIPVVIVGFGISTVLGIVFVIVAVLTVILVNLIGSTLNGIYVAAVYQYAIAEGGQPQLEYFSQDMIEGAFRPK